MELSNSNKMRIMVGAHSMPRAPFRHKRLGNLFSPKGFWNCDLPFALDNYVFAAWRKGQEWDIELFVSHLDKVKSSGKVPLWAIVPDAVGDSDLSLKKWKEWAPRIRGEYGWDLAFAVQDGQKLAEVPDAEVIFVGGSTRWKYQNIEFWCNNFPRVHVGRINTYRWLWHCHKCGAESIDGTGWHWERKREYQDLIDYLEITEGIKACESTALFPLYPYSRPAV